uniref:Mitochondrial import receptor subunit TOM20 homolog n=1 Tax=Salarias fasciatus TaxID=181472 RepID=A0A672GX59_SALFA
MMGGRSSAIAAGVCGALFVGYCIYFDRKRRSDPDFKNRLRERRRKQKAAKERAGMTKLPDLKDAEAVQKFFLEEIQLGEELLAQGDYEKGVDHLTNAIAVCGQPQQLLQVLQQTLPPPVFQMLLTKLPSISQVAPPPSLFKTCSFPDDHLQSHQHVRKTEKPSNKTEKIKSHEMRPAQTCSPRHGLRRRNSRRCWIHWTSWSSQFPGEPVLFQQQRLHCG